MRDCDGTTLPSNALELADKEIGFSLNTDKYNIQQSDKHFIFEDLTTAPDYGEDKKNIYALDGTQILDIKSSVAVPHKR